MIRPVEARDYEVPPKDPKRKNVTPDGWRHFVSVHFV